MKAFITSILPWARDDVRLQWDLEEVTESGSFTFELQRSGSPAGPWTVVETFVDVYTGSDDLSLRTLTYSPYLVIFTIVFALYLLAERSMSSFLQS